MREEKYNPWEWDLKTHTPITLNKKWDFKVLSLCPLPARAIASWWDQMIFPYYLLLLFLCLDVDFHRWGGKPCFGLSPRERLPQIFSVLSIDWMLKHLKDNKYLGDIVLDKET